jgi:hypothetical protein
VTAVHPIDGAVPRPGPDATAAARRRSDLDARAVRGAAWGVALGGVLLILHVPLVGPLGPIVGSVLIVVVLARLLERLTDHRARRGVARALRLALVVGLCTGVLVLGELTAWPDRPRPVWLPVVATAQVTLGVLGTLLLTTAAGRAAEVRGWTEATWAWSRASFAVAVVHGPLAAVTVIAYATGRASEVTGLAGVVLFALAAVPYAAIAWAGSRSGPHAASAPSS